MEVPVHPFELAEQLFTWQGKQVKRPVAYRGALQQVLLTPNQAAYVVDCATANIVDVAGNFERLVGIPNQRVESNLHLYERVMHRDLPEVVKYSRRAMEYCYWDREAEVGAITLSLNYRMKDGKGKYKQVLRNSFAVQKDGDTVTHTLGILTDITHLGTLTKVRGKIEGPRTHAFDLEVPEVKEFFNVFTPRELEILKLLARGCKSQQISEALHISYHTVSTHRRNMIKRLEAESTIDLLNLARDMGLM